MRANLPVKLAARHSTSRWLRRGESPSANAHLSSTLPNPRMFQVAIRTLRSSDFGGLPARSSDARSAHVPSYEGAAAPGLPTTKPTRSRSTRARASPAHPRAQAHEIKHDGLLLSGGPEDPPPPSTLE